VPSRDALILAGGICHFAILIASGLVPSVLNWREELDRLSPFLRKLFWVYGAFIVLVIVGFGTVSVLNHETLAAGSPLARSVCGFVAVFWLARLFVQFFVFDAAPFKHRRVLMIGYHGLTVLFLYLVVAYGLTAVLPRG